MPNSVHVNAQVWFETLSLQPLQLLGQEALAAALPEAAVALPEALRQRAASTWETTFLDHSMRVSHANSGGTVLLFEREQEEELGEGQQEAGWRWRPAAAGGAPRAALAP